jgi:hypothetical protein
MNKMVGTSDVLKQMPNLFLKHSEHLILQNQVTLVLQKFQFNVWVLNRNYCKTGITYLSKIPSY